MSTITVDVAIIGAGTAGLSAFREVKKATDKVVLIEGGPLGTTCARVGCMPSKVMIQVAADFARRKVLAKQGINGGDNLTLDIAKAMEYVRSLRDRFAGGVVKDMEKLKSSLIIGYAKFIAADTLQVGQQQIKAKAIIIATGSSNIIPPAWQPFANSILTSDSIFEQTGFADEIAVIGTGVIGLELGQALARFGLKVQAFGANDFIGGLTDPAVNKVAVEAISKDLPLCLGERADISCDGSKWHIKVENKIFHPQQVLASLGRSPNLQKLQLENAGVSLDEQGFPNFDPCTLQVEDLPIFIAGDCSKQRPLLHEAADEGRIAGYNAIAKKVAVFKRRAPLYITFSDPNIAIVGKRFSELNANDIVVGEVSFANQGRSRIKSKNQGMMHVYADRKNGKFLGAEMVAPAGEHMAHILAWALQQKMTVFDILQMPFYHPVVEEGMRTAIRDVVRKVESEHKAAELAICDSAAEQSLA